MKQEQVMSETKRKIFNGEFKAKVALEAIRCIIVGGVHYKNLTNQEIRNDPLSKYRLY